MKTLIIITFFSFLCISHCFSQVDLEPAYLHEITNKGKVVYYKNSPFTGLLLLDEKTNLHMGEFYNGYKNGLYIEYYTDGKKKSEGRFSNGIEEGTHTEWFENGNKKSEINYNNGKKDGKQQEWFENGQKQIENNLISDMYDKTQMEWYENGNIKSEVNYFLGTPNGYHIFYYNNKNKEKEVVYKNGEILKTTEWNSNNTIKTNFEYIKGKVKDGNYILTDETGKKVSKQTFIGGNKTEEFTFKGGDKTGKLIKWYNNKIEKFACDYLDGKINGEFMLHDENGQLISSGNYSKGLKEGKFTFYCEGKLVCEENYKNDVPDGEVVWYNSNNNRMFQKILLENNPKYKFWGSNNEIIYENK